MNKQVKYINTVFPLGFFLAVGAGLSELAGEEYKQQKSPVNLI